MMPNSEQKWVSCLVKTEDFQSSWAGVKDTCDVFTLGKSPSTSEMMVIISDAIVPWLSQNGFPFSVAIDDDWAKPHSREIAVLGKVQAERKARSRFVKGCIQGARSALGPGFDHHILSIGGKRFLEVRWAILIRDILVGVWGRGLQTICLHRFRTLQSLISFFKVASSSACTY